MIDLSMMRNIQVNPQTHTARAEAGAVWGDYDAAAQAFGLATTGGVERTTGIAGCGHRRRRKAGGESRTELRSVLGSSWGGDNLRIVTSFEYRLHHVESVYGGLMAYPTDRAREIIRRCDHFVVSAPDELGSLLVLGTLPDGTKAVILLICHCGGEEEGRQCAPPWTGAGTPLMNQLGQMP